MALSFACLQCRKFVFQTQREGGGRSPVKKSMHSFIVGRDHTPSERALAGGLYFPHPCLFPRRSPCTCPPSYYPRLQKKKERKYITKTHTHTHKITTTTVFPPCPLFKLGRGLVSLPRHDEPAISDFVFSWGTFLELILVGSNNSTISGAICFGYI